MAAALAFDSGQRTIIAATSAQYTWSPTNPTANTHHVIGCANLYFDDYVNLTYVRFVDNQSNTWTKHVNKDQTVTGAYSSNGDITAISSSHVTTSSGTFTTTLDGLGSSGNIYGHWCLLVVSGLATVSWFDKAGDNCHGPSTDAAPACTSQNSQADEFVVAGCALDINDSTLNIGTPSGYTALYTVNSGTSYPGGQTVYKVLSGLETSSATWTHDNHATDWGVASAIATFKAATAAAVTASRSDAVTATDSGSAGVQLVRVTTSRSDAITATDSATAGVQVVRVTTSAADSATVTDSAAQVISPVEAVIGDTLVVVDAGTGAVQVVRVTADGYEDLGVTDESVAAVVSAFQVLSVSAAEFGEVIRFQSANW